MTTARFRIQEALNTLNRWTKHWLVKINSKKTTYTIFSLSPKEQSVNLYIDEQKINEDKTPTYLGITFDKRLTWKQQIEKAELKAKTRLSLMRRLAGTSWGADFKTLKKVYTGYVRPTLEYGAATWSTTAKSHLDKLNKVQNQASRIMTGGLKSTPIKFLEKTTHLQSTEDRMDSKVLLQASKFKRMVNHPMKARMVKPTQARLQRGNFMKKNKALQNQTDVLKISPKDIPQCLTVPPWRQELTDIRVDIPGIEVKANQDCSPRKSIAEDFVDNQYPKDTWTRLYTDGSSEQAVKNGGAGVYIYSTQTDIMTSKNTQQGSMPQTIFQNVLL